MKFQPFFDADKGGSGNGEDSGNPASADVEEAKTYTQADLDRMFAERAKQAQTSEQKRILDALGAKDLTEAKTLLAKQREADQAQLTEAERLKAQLAEYEREREDTRRAQRETYTKYEIKLQAQALGITDPEDAYRLINLDDLEYDDSGKPKNLETLLRKLVQKKPYLVSGGTSAANPAGSQKNQIDDPMILAARRAAGLMGGG